MTPRHRIGVSIFRVGAGFSVLFGLAIYAGASPIDETAFAARPAPGIDLVVSVGPIGAPRLVGPGVRALAAFTGNPVIVPDAASLGDEYDRLGYFLADIRSDDVSVPRVFLSHLPKDLPMVQSVPVRKSLFIRSLLPLVLHANEEILADRARIEMLRDRIAAGQAVTPTDAAWLDGLSISYGLVPRDLAGLLHRHDQVPVGLALAQGIEESGWGTSRFALHGNAVFGQWTFSKGAGLVPLEREDGALHEVKAFPTLTDSVRQYVRNLNNHRAYREFRNERAALRRHGKPIDSIILAKTMTRYSQRGARYVGTILGLITSNDLDGLDASRLGAVSHRPIDS
ncbi:MAG: glucosaminidase domain-containing protein [Alphaproteobacteria bacterium]|nr:glucosaminidase domain-containing protein [Alphaproteobacteria bacterium]